MKKSKHMKKSTPLHDQKNKVQKNKNNTIRSSMRFIQGSICTMLHNLEQRTQNPYQEIYDQHCVYFSRVHAFPVVESSIQVRNVFIALRYTSPVVVVRVHWKY